MRVSISTTRDLGSEEGSRTVSAARPQDTEEYLHAAAVAQDVRERVADQLHDLVIEAGALGSDGELARAVNRIGQAKRQLNEARGRQQQAREMGLPVAPHVTAEREALTLLRQSVMSCGAACGLWCAAMDFEHKRAELARPISRNGRRRQRDEDTI